MRKKIIIIGAMLLILVGLALIFMGNGEPANGGEKGEETQQSEPVNDAEGEASEENAIKIDLFSPQDVEWKKEPIITMVKQFFLLVLLITLVKFFWLKRKLAFSWELKYVEKLFASTFAEVLVEMIFFSLFFYFFAPLSASLLKTVGYTAAATKMGLFVSFFWYTLLVTPYLCAVAALTTAILIDLNKPEDNEQRTQHFWLGARMGLITPAILLLFNLGITLLFK